MRFVYVQDQSSTAFRPIKFRFFSLTLEWLLRIFDYKSTYYLEVKVITFPNAQACSHKKIIGAYFSLGTFLDLEIAEYVRQTHFHFHQSKSHTNAVPWSGTKRQISVLITLFPFLG